MEDDHINILPVAEVEVIQDKKESIKLPCINPLSSYPDPLDQHKLHIAKNKQEYINQQRIYEDENDDNDAHQNLNSSNSN